MSGGELTPERLDALIDGETPASTSADRDALALAASLRDASPGASDALRARVRALPEPEPHRRGPFRRLRAVGWRRRALVAAPALAAAIAVVFAVGVLDDGGAADRVSQPDAPAVAATSTDALGVAESTSPDASAPGPVESADPAAVNPARTKALATTTVLIPPGATADRVAEATRIVGAAGGTAAAAPAGPDDPATVLTITLPPDRATAALAAVAALGDTPGGIAAPAGDSPVRILFREATADAVP